MEGESLDLVLGSEVAGMPVDRAVASSSDFSRRQVRRSIDQGGLFVNGRQVRKGGESVGAGDRVLMCLLPLPSLAKVEVLYEDGDFVAINKAPRMSMADLDGWRDLLPCHRLDKDTSGVLLLAKTQAAQKVAMDWFREKRVSKEYLALCYGEIREKVWEERGNILDLKSGLSKVVSKGGRWSKTRFKLLERFSGGVSLVRCLPETGRRHQIRLHLLEGGMFVAGDKRYGKVLDRFGLYGDLFWQHHFLHALSLDLPGMKKIEASLPLTWREFAKLSKSKCLRVL